MVSPVLVIGIGNEYRSDDAVGLIVVRSLKAERLPATVCLENDGDGTSLMETWKDAGKVILIDVTSSQAPPGTIYRFDALASPLPATCSFPSTHTFSVAEAILMGQALDQLPASLIVYGIEGKNFSAGTSLSPEVENAVGEVVARITREIQNSQAN